MFSILGHFSHLCSFASGPLAEHLRFWRVRGVLAGWLGAVVSRLSTLGGWAGPHCFKWAFCKSSSCLSGLVQLA